MDLGAIIHRMTRRKNEGAKYSLKTELLQYRDALMVKRQCPETWQELLWEQIGLKKSSLFSGIKSYQEFSHLILVPVAGDGDDAVDVDCRYATIPVSSLHLCLKVAKGCNDEVKERWLADAASLSYTDFAALVNEAIGKEPHECGPFEQTQAWRCVSCGKIRAKAVDGDT